MNKEQLIWQICNAWFLIESNYELIINFCLVEF